jgi:hypothetical protein
VLPEDAEKMKELSEKTKRDAQEALEASSTEVPHIAYGIFKDTNGEWKLAKVIYDPETGKAELVEKIHTGGYRAMASEQFKIEVARTLLI